MDFIDRIVNRSYLKKNQNNQRPWSTSMTNCKSQKDHFFVY